MKKLAITTLSFSVLALCASQVSAANVTVNTSSYSDATTYMSWSTSAYTAANFPGDGGTGAGGWSLAALPAVISGANVTISPNVNTYAPGVGYWTNPDGTGANQMDAAVYTETTGLYVNTSVTFSFDVLANTLAASALGGGYTADAFIKDFGPGFAYNGESTVPLTVGNDSVTYALTGNNPGEIVQYGFELIGPDANPATVAGLGSVVIGPAAVPEPASVALLLAGLGMVGGLARRRAARQA